MIRRNQKDFMKYSSLIHSSPDLTYYEMGRLLYRYSYTNIHKSDHARDKAEQNALIEAEEKARKENKEAPGFIDPRTLRYKEMSLKQISHLTSHLEWTLIAAYKAAHWPGMSQDIIKIGEIRNGGYSFCLIGEVTPPPRCLLKNLFELVNKDKQNPAYILDILTGQVVNARLYPSELKQALFELTEKGYWMGLFDKDQEDEAIQRGLFTGLQGYDLSKSYTPFEIYNKVLSQAPIRFHTINQKPNKGLLARFEKEQDVRRFMDPRDQENPTG